MISAVTTKFNSATTHGRKSSSASYKTSSATPLRIASLSETTSPKKAMSRSSQKSDIFKVSCPEKFENAEKTDNSQLTMATTGKKRTLKTHNEHERATAAWIRDQTQLRNDLLGGTTLLHIDDEDTVRKARERIEILQYLPHFPWSKSHTERRQDNIDKLIRYQKENGHCRVPQRSEDGLGRYVNNLREDYKICLRGGKCRHLTNDMVEKLNGIGFEWTVKKSSQEAWDSKYDALVEYKRQHQHCNVRRKTEGNEELSALGKWVTDQRGYFKRGKLSDEKVQRLNDIGFKWSMKSCGK
ncbi:hypothetical protein HJC23_005099 [Cyclotella cryptica]|uniref:Helicase-associated domain-containing protein n=1 Tax=Cyclotella cryptica TaxID=29204 RepID=A0ABD3QMJ3_9STRA